MKNLKQAISVALFAALTASAVFNILHLLDIAGRALTQVIFIILIAAAFIVSALGLILKDIMKEENISVNVATPVKEIGRLYIWVFIIWLISYFCVLIFK